jgi:hypothetical protein
VFAASGAGLRERSRAARPMLAGRPHEAAGNGSPRWMTAGPRKRAHRTRPTGRLTLFYASDLRRSDQRASWFRPCSVRATAGIASMAPWPRSSASGKVRRDQPRGVEVPRVVEPRARRQAVCRVGACLIALTGVPRRGRWSPPPSRTSRLRSWQRSHARTTSARSRWRMGSFADSDSPRHSRRPDLPSGQPPTAPDRMNVKTRREDVAEPAPASATISRRVSAGRSGSESRSTVKRYARPAASVLI